jgi:hypothetical protein
VGWQLPNGSLKTVQLVASDTPDVGIGIVESQFPAPRVPKELSSDEVRARVGAVSRRLSSCADKWVTLEGVAGGGGAMVAAVHIGAGGNVAKVTVRGEGREVPATVRDCVTSVLGRIVFSTADEPTDVELPIRVTAHGQ